MKKTNRIIWHWKHFDLHAPLEELRRIHGQNVQLSGLLTLDSSGCPEELGNSFLGVPRMSQHRLNHYQRCIALLHEQYKEHDYELTTSAEGIERYVARLEALPGKAEIWYYPHIGSEELGFMAAVKRRTSADVAWKKFRPNTLLAPEELPFALASLPQTFSQFRKEIERKPYAFYNFAGGYQRLSPTGSEARKRVEHYIFRDKQILTYKQTRNGLGQGDYSSRLSPWLAVHAIQAGEIGSAILDFEQRYSKNESTYWLLFELLWRDYFYFLHAKHGVNFFRPRGTKGIRSPGLHDTVHWKFPGSSQPMTFQTADRDILLRHWENFRAWARGTTGERFVDVIMRELFFTGAISNRARQCAASYLIHDLHVPWWWGAQWFEYLLVDYDVSSNWGNWAYLAGVGADPRPSRKFNMQLQARKYDPDGAYRTWGMEQRWDVPEEALPVSLPN